MTRTISINHLARVEGHGGIQVVIDGGQVSKVEFDVFEGIRLLEGLSSQNGHYFNPGPTRQDLFGQFLYIGKAATFRIVCDRIETTWTTERAALEPNDRPQSQPVGPAGLTEIITSPADNGTVRLQGQTVLLSCGDGHKIG